jgi:hypothetical protein
MIHDIYLGMICVRHLRGNKYGEGHSPDGSRQGQVLDNRGGRSHLLSIRRFITKQTAVNRFVKNDFDDFVRLENLAVSFCPDRKHNTAGGQDVKFVFIGPVRKPMWPETAAGPHAREQPVAVMPGSAHVAHRFQRELNEKLPQAGVRKISVDSAGTGNGAAGFPAGFGGFFDVPLVVAFPRSIAVDDH